MDDHHKKEDRVGFKGIALINRKERNVIIAYRGTEPAIKRNLAVDLGLFLTAGGNSPGLTLCSKFVDFGRHYGGVDGALLATAAVTARSVLDGVGGDWLEFALVAMCNQADLDVISSEHMKGLTLTCANHALQFCEQVEKDLLAESREPAPGLLSQAGTFLGYQRDPRLERPGGYRIWVTGHSLGGFLAQIVAACEGRGAVTFNAPGAAEFLRANARHFKAQLRPRSRRSRRNPGTAKNEMTSHPPAVQVAAGFPECLDGRGFSRAMDQKVSFSRKRVNPETDLSHS